MLDLSPTGTLGRTLNSHRGLQALALVLLVLGSYAPALGGGVLWDDQVVHLDKILGTAAGLRQIWFTPSVLPNEGHYWPVVYTSLWLEHQLWGGLVAGHHLGNLIYMIGVVLVMWRVLRALEIPGAWLGAALFAVHPVHVESVAWILARKDLLSALFYGLALLAFVRSVARPGATCLLLSLFAFLLALLSKSIVVTLPLVLLLWLWWRRPAQLRAQLPRVILFGALALLVTSLDLRFLWQQPTVEFERGMVERLLGAARAHWFYLDKLVWPHPLLTIYPGWSEPGDSVVAWLVLIAMLVLPVGLFWGRRWWGSGPLVASLFFTVTIAPALGVIEFNFLRFAPVADRFQFLASSGPLALVGAGAALAFRGRGRWGRLLVAAAVTVTLLLSIGLDRRQCARYRDLGTLFRATLADNPEAWAAHAFIGFHRAGLGDHRQALEHYQRALDLKHGDRQTRLYRAGSWIALGRLAEARDDLEALLVEDPDSYEARNELANVLSALGEPLRAVEQLEQAVRLRPGAVEAYVNQGAVLMELGRFEAAAEAYRRALDLAPDHVVALNNMGNLHADRGDIVHAERYYRRALDRDPGYTLARHNLALLLLTSGQLDEAVVEGARLVEQQVDSASAHALLGDALGRSGRVAEAARHHRAARSLEPGVAGHCFNLGLDLVQLGRFEEATRELHRAVQTDSTFAELMLPLARAARERGDEARELVFLTAMQPD